MEIEDQKYLTPKGAAEPTRENGRATEKTLADY